MSGGVGVVPRSRVSGEQLEILLSFMEEHPDFAAGKQSVYSRFSSSKLWRLLAERLNGSADNTGGARKSPDKWCRYWADIKYKARKKTAAGGALGDLSNVEERLKAILDHSGALLNPRVCNSSEANNEDEEDMCSEGSGGAGGAGGGSSGDRIAAEELLAEAAMRSALAAEKQAEAVAQGVEVLREILSVLRPLAAAATAPPPTAAPPTAAADLHLAAMQHHPPHPGHPHHRLN